MNPFKEVILALEKNDVTYVIVGGFAAVMHGCNRFTADLDIIVDFNKSNIESLVKSMESIGFSARLPINPLELADTNKRQEWIARNMQVFTFLKSNNPLFLLDVFIYHPIDFSTLLKSSKDYPYEGGKIKVCDIDSLISLKKMANRPKDMEDIKQLLLLKNKA